jgi:hypothetical protein
MFKSLRLRPMTYESLHSKSCGGGLCFVRAKKEGLACFGTRRRFASCHVCLPA